MYPTGHPGHGHLVPGKIRHGEDGRVCSGHAAADRACGWTGMSSSRSECMRKCNSAVNQHLCPAIQSGVGAGDVSHT